MEIGDQKPKPGICCWWEGRKGLGSKREAGSGAEHDTLGETEAQRGHVVPTVHIIGSGRAENELHLDSRTGSRSPSLGTIKQTPANTYYSMT